MTTIPEEPRIEEPAPPVATTVLPAKTSAVEDLSSGLLNFTAFWKDYRKLLREPSLACDDPDGRLSLRPLPFALQSAVIMFGTVALCLWFLTYIVNLPALPDDFGMAHQQAAISARLAKTTDAKERATLEQASRRVDIEVKGEDIEQGIQKGATGPSFLLGALLFAWLLRRYVRDYPTARAADRLYLYYLTARTFAPSYVFIVSTYICQRLLGIAVSDDSIARSPAFLPFFILVYLVFTVSGIWSLVAGIRSCWTISDLLGFPRQRANGSGFNGPIRVLLLLFANGVIIGSFVLALAWGAKALYLRLML